ncbi:MAG: Gfo/Idh/MocA family oxidoreductase [Desulfotomaculum sp.]|nr:Gfo/Idh/MocA family oxidoreductase [Desulfotomaculum sp.]
MIGTALIGCGAWGSAYLRTLSAMPEADLLYVCDSNKEVQKKLALAYPQIKVISDYQNLLNDPEVQAVIIATPPGSHYQIAADCLTSGKSILVEKPITTNLDDAKKLVKLAWDTGRVLMPGHLMVYHPAIEIVKDYIERDVFGEIKFMHFQRTNINKYREDVNVLWDLTIHDLYIMFYLLQDVPVRVYARGMKWKEDLPMGVMLVDCEFSDNILVHIHSSWHSTGKKRRLCVVGTELMAEFNGTASVDKNLILVRPDGHTEEVYLPKEEPLYRQCKHFLQCIQQDKQPLSNGVDAVLITDLMEKIDYSLALRKAVYCEGDINYES